MLPVSEENFPQAFRGYDKEAVDARVEALLSELSLARQTARHRQQEADAARTEAASLREKVKNNSNFGYADLGSQFEQTLRVAEEQAKKLISDAGQEAIRIRDTAQAEADQSVRKAEATVARMVNEAEQRIADIKLQATAGENAIKTQRAQAEQDIIEIKIQARQEASEIVAAAKAEVTVIKAEAMDEVDLVRNETNRTRIEAQDALVIAQAKATDILAKANAQILADRAAAIAELEAITAQVTAKRNEHESTQRLLDQLRAQTDVEITEKRRAIEQEIREMYASATANNEQTMKRAEAALEDANQRAADVTLQADAMLRAAENEAEEMINQTRRDTFHMITEARKRAEALTTRAEGYALKALQDAEARQQGLNDDFNNIRDFAESLKSLMSTDALVSVIEATALTASNEDAAKRKAGKKRFAGRSLDESETVDAEIVAEDLN